MRLTTTQKKMNIFFLQDILLFGDPLETIVGSLLVRRLWRRDLVMLSDTETGDNTQASHHPDT